MTNNIKSIHSYRNEDVVAMLECWLDMAKRGEITNVVITAHRRGTKEAISACSFEDAWVMLGALEHAENTVLCKINGIGEWER